MSSVVLVSTFAHSVTYVADKILLSLKELIRDSGLSPQKLATEWEVLQSGVSTWLRTQDLQSLVLEVFDPQSDALVGRWDFELSYGAVGDGGMWVNTEDIKYHILKAGLWPAKCDYRIVVNTRDGRPNVIGWSSTMLRSTEGFVRHGIGTTVDGNGAVKATTAYWRKPQ